MLPVSATVNLTQDLRYGSSIVQNSSNGFYVQTTFEAIAKIIPVRATVAKRKNLCENKRRQTTYRTFAVVFSLDCRPFR